LCMIEKPLHVLGRPFGLVLICLYEFLTGLFEILLGAGALLFDGILVEELATDPGNIFINWILNNVDFTVDTSQQIGLILLFFGIVKLLISYGIWLQSWKLRRVMILFFLLTTTIIVIELLFRFSLIKVFTLGVDALFLYYLWKILPRHLRHYDKLGPV